MKKLGLIITTIGFVGFITVGSKFNLFGSNNADRFPKLPDAPDFVVSTKFDGNWMGRRIDVTNNNLCERTTITGKIVDGKASLMLTYNGTSLKGWISETGSLVLYANNRQWDYRFTGQAGKERLSGKWHLTNGPCKGTWYVERQAS